jgi:hypothetical protein
VYVTITTTTTNEEIVDSLDDEDEVLLVMAEELGNFVDVVGGPSMAFPLLTPLESLATVDEASVRDMAVKSICRIVEQMQSDHIAEHFVAALRRLVTRDWFTSRNAACHLFQVGYAKVSTTIQSELLENPNLYKLRHGCHINNTPLVFVQKSSSKPLETWPIASQMLLSTRSVNLNVSKSGNFEHVAMINKLKNSIKCFRM